MKEGKKRPQDISKIEKDKRINAVHTLILQGASNSQIVQYCSKEYKITDRATYNYINEVRAIIREDFLKTDDADVMKSEIFARLENLYQQNMDIDDLKECRNILKDIRDMLGLNAPQKTDITTKGESVNNAISVQIIKTDED